MYQCFYAWPQKQHWDNSLCRWGISYESCCKYICRFPMQVLHACIARKSLKFTWKNFRLIFRFAILGCMWTYKKLLVAAAFGFHWRPIVFFFIIIIILFATIFFAIKTFYDSFRRYLSKCLTLFFPVSLLIPPYNLRFYDVFRGVKRKQWKENG